jgi:hypothetical protein
VHRRVERTGFCSGGATLLAAEGRDKVASWARAGDWRQSTGGAHTQLGHGFASQYCVSQKHLSGLQAPSNKSQFYRQKMRG